MRALKIHLLIPTAVGLFLMAFHTGCGKSNSSHEMKHADDGSMTMSESMGTHDHGEGSPTIRLSFSTPPLRAGKTVEVKANLLAIDGSPVTLNDLKEVHTKKIHFLIIDPSFSDYHHVHPVPTSKPGEYTFSFAPKKPGPYRVWADLHPLKTDRQEYVIADLPGEGVSEKFKNPQVSMKTVLDGITFEIGSDVKILKKGEPALFKFRISDRSGKVVDQLEPVMGAYAHIVGFSQDYKTIAHVHPMGVEPEKESDRGKGDLEFHLQPSVSGYIRLFAQIKLNNQEKFAGFFLNVE